MLQECFQTSKMLLNYCERLHLNRIDFSRNFEVILNVFKLLKYFKTISNQNFKTLQF